MNNEIYQRIEDNLTKFMSISKSHGYDVPKPTVTIKSSVRSAGKCGVGGITLSKEYLLEFETEQLWNTLGHEFAHWIQRCNKMFTRTRTGRRKIHDWRFKALCIMLGVSDKTTHSMTLANAPVRRRNVKEVNCGCPGIRTVTSFKYNHILRGTRGWSCRVCKVTLTA